MNPSWWLQNLASYSTQVLVIVACGGLLAWLLRLRNPKAALVFWQALLAACLLLPVLQPWHPTGVSTPAAGPSAAGTSGVMAGAAFRWDGFLVGLLVCGMLARLLFLALGHVRLYLYRQAARKLLRIPRDLGELKQALGAWPAVYLSAEIDNAVTFGFFQPVVLLPDRFVAMSPDVRRVILCHELLHVRRGDWLCALAEETLRGVLWFHPAIWWLVDRIQLAREQVIDQGVVELTRGRDAYLEALLDAADRRTRHSPAPAFSLPRRRHLRQRVALLLKEDSMSRTRLMVSFAAMAAGLLLAGWLTTSSFPLRAAQQGESGSDVYKVADGGVTAPRLTYKVEPGYDPEAKDDKIEGIVVLGAEVWPDGLAHNLKILRSLHEGLDMKAQEAIQQWRFEPGKKGGKPVKVAATIEVHFRLK